MQAQKRQKIPIPAHPDVSDLIRTITPLQEEQIDLRTQMYAGFASLLFDTDTRLVSNWHDIAHPFQQAPKGDWSVWLLMAGRGSGKTRAAAEYITDEVVAGRARIIGLVGPTAGDVRDVMVEGPAGLLKVAEMRGIQAIYHPSRREVVWPEYGAAAKLFSAQEPRRLRGPQHDHIWAEEVAAWQDAWQGDAEETTWNNMMFGFRLGEHPRCVVTTTPKANKLTKDIVKRALKDTTEYVITTGSTYDNKANLAPIFYNTVIERYNGTRLGQQEIYGMLLEDVEGALWVREWIDKGRIPRDTWWPTWLKSFTNPDVPPEPPDRLDRTLTVPVIRAEDYGPFEAEIQRWPLPDMRKVVVTIDPNTSDNPNADVAGIIVAARGVDGDGYVFDDLSVLAGPDEWSKAAVKAYHFWLADKLVAERNNGGEMVKITIRQHDEHVQVDLVWASRGKITRAEPVAALYEQGRIHHIGVFEELEDELCSFVGGSDASPGRLDALVWAFTDLFELTPDGPDQRDRRTYVF